MSVNNPDVGTGAVERKTAASAVGSYLFGVGLLAVINWVTRTNLLGSLPDVAEVFLDPIIPAVGALVLGYVTKHVPGALSASALAAARARLGASGVDPLR
jgi:hypothetical protein